MTGRTEAPGRHPCSGRPGRRILGAHLLGPNAAEIINLFPIAIRLRISAFDPKQVPFAYPTYDSDIRFMI